MEWKSIYEKTLKTICEADGEKFENIVEIEEPDYSVELIENPNANENSLYTFKLDDGATNEDYKKFVEYVYGYIGEDINDYIPNEEENTDKEKGDADVDTNMDDKAQEKIRVLLKRYGADGKEIENFMRDLLEFKEADEEDEIKEDEGKDFNYLDEETMAKLRATEEGKDLIMNAPKMAKDELEKAIKEYLSK